MIYDLVILGGGPAGYLAAERAGHAGIKTALIEERSLGGVCLNEGCIPTKTLLYSAKIYDSASHGEKYGVRADGLTIDHAAVIRRKDKVVKLLVSGVGSAMKANGVDVIKERGIIKGRSPDGIQVVAGEQVITGKRLLIASGSSPAVPPIEGLKAGMERGFVLTSREILDLKEKPARLLIIGGGIIGLEFASYFSSIGTQVQVVEMLDHIAGENDPEMIALLKETFEKRGIAFALSAKVTAIEEKGVRFEQNGVSQMAETDLVLLSIGRRANIRDIGLENLSLCTERGGITVDDRMRTSQPDIWAAGDVTGYSMFAHTAYREAEVAVNDMLGIQDRMRYNAIPAVIYTNPELSAIGETESSAAAKGLPFETVKVSLRYSGRYLAENEGGNGLMKLIVNRETRQVLGAAVLANYSSEFIVAAGTWIETGMTLDMIKRVVFPHPTVSEILREAIFRYE